MPDRTVLTLGNFDGPHVGHHSILEKSRKIADVHNAKVLAVTFDPPPLEVLRPGDGPPRITSLAQRIKRLRRGGADDVRVIEPTAELLGQSAPQFIERLVERHHPVAIVEGPDFRFGKNRGGDMAALATLGQEHGFEAVTVPRVEVALGDQQLTAVSSSLVRWLIGRGRVADAAVCLGRFFSLTATVVRGEQRGKKLGIPTANLDADQIAPYIVPADGVYAGYVRLEQAEVGGEQSGEGPSSRPSEAPDAGGATPLATRSTPIPAAISVGIKPTFGKTALTVEAHLIDTDLDLYGKTITLGFARWVRDQYPFPGVDALREQLHRDIQQARQWHTAGRLTDSHTSIPVKA